MAPVRKHKIICVNSSIIVVLNNKTNNTCPSDPPSQPYPRKLEIPVNQSISPRELQKAKPQTKGVAILVNNVHVKYAWTNSELYVSDTMLTRSFGGS